MLIEVPEAVGVKSVLRRVVEGLEPVWMRICSTTLEAMVTPGDAESVARK
jgi:hypothetical protein